MEAHAQPQRSRKRPSRTTRVPDAGNGASAAAGAQGPGVPVPVPVTSQGWGQHPVQSQHQHTVQQVQHPSQHGVPQHSQHAHQTHQVQQPHPGAHPHQAHHQQVQVQHQHQHQHPQAVRAHPDTVSAQPPTFASQQLDTRSHQVPADTDGLMNGYNAPQHQQYPDPPPSSLAPAPQPDNSGLTSLSNLTGDNGASHQQHHQQRSQHQQLQLQHHAQQQHQQQQQQQQQQAQQAQQQQQRSSVAPSSTTDRVNFNTYPNHSAPNDSSPSPVTVATSSAGYNNLSGWTQPVTNSTAQSTMPPPSPAPALAPPPEGIYRTFEDLLASVQKVAKDQGYGVVKLRASNYREGKPTRYDLVCDRGGVKYSSTAKKRNPSTRKVDCPWRAKAVCEVNLGNQWRFAVQEARHNHEPRIPAAVPGQENTPIAQSIRSITNKIDRLQHDQTTSFQRLEANVSTILARIDNMEKRLDAIESGRPSMLGGNGVPSMGTPSMPTANMGGGNLGNGPMTNGGMSGGHIVDTRLNSMEARMNAMEQRGNPMDGLPMMDDDTGRLAMNQMMVST
ncbi:hypothetical protein N0V85_002133 [Neurospora sp. IMI 360204]|nr:hypothetical protein N0V85_002133 [Neurospora sp. IMI 360204]